MQEIIDTCDFFTGECDGSTPIPDLQRCLQQLSPSVSCWRSGIITAGNFPSRSLRVLIPALTCGNAVVWKPAEYSPAIGDALAKLFVAGGLPDGVLNVVQAEGPAAFEGLGRALDEGLVDKVGFTGSSGVGKKIGELCGRHMQSPCLELGGKNPLVVMPDADLDLAVEGALFSGFGTAGQRCTSLGTVIVHESVHDEFISRFARAVEGRIGDPTKTCSTADAQRALPRAFWVGSSSSRPIPVFTVRAVMDPLAQTTPARAFVGDPEPASTHHPTSSTALRGG